MIMRENTDAFEPEHRRVGTREVACLQSSPVGCDSRVREQVAFDDECVDGAFLECVKAYPGVV